MDERGCPKSSSITRWMAAKSLVGARSCSFCNDACTTATEQSEMSEQLEVGDAEEDFEMGEGILVH
jgi:hypothetical protein